MSSIVFRTLTLMSVLLCGVSADQGVSLHCNQTVYVTSGKGQTLTCDIEIKQKDCDKVPVEWNDSVENLCVKNTCTTDNKTFASLQMSNVTENKTITVKIDAYCGMDSKNITVKVHPGVQPSARRAEFQTTTATTKPPEKDKIIAISVAAVSAVIIVAAGVLFLYKRNKKSPVCPTEESGTQTVPMKNESDLV